MIKQRSPEWYRARIGKFTASNLSELLAKPADKSALWSKSALNCIEKAATQLYFNHYYERPDNEATRWGIRNEPKAIESFSRKSQFETSDIGFVLHPEMPDVGATPDAVVFENGEREYSAIAEIKCPYNSTNHLDYFKRIINDTCLKRIKSAYYWQIQGEIWVTGANHGYFISYDSRFQEDKQLHYVKIERDHEAIKQISETVTKSINLRNDILEAFDSNRRRPRSLDSFY